MDGALEISTTLTMQDRVEASLWATHAAQPGRRRTNLFWALAAILAGSLVGLLAGWADGPKDLLAILRQTPAMLRTPYSVLIALLLAIAIGRYVFYDWFTRRRIARWVLAEQGAETVAFLYRVDPSGLTVEDETGAIHVAGSGIAGLHETPGAFYVGCGGGLVSALIVPKHGVVPADQDRFRAALSSVIGAAPGPVLPAGPSDVDDSTEITLRYDQTKEDSAAALWESWNTPSARRRRALAALAVAVCLALLVPVFAVVDWLLDPDPNALATLVGHARKEFWTGALVAIVISVGGWMLTRRLIRKQALAISASRAGAAQPARFAIAPYGFVLAIPDSVWRYGWQTVRGYSETPDHVFLKLRFGQVIALPRRAFDASGLAALRRLTAEHLQGVGRA